MADVLTTFETVASRQVPPDPGILKAIGLNHEFESAVADLVDNSLDAAASRVLVRFVLREGLVRQLLVVDNGRGMDAAELDSAMQLGRPKDSPDALGHFGMGLKSSSFSQASELTVLSRRRGGRAEGRRMVRERKGPTFDVEVLDSGQVRTALDTQSNDFTTDSCTVIRWDKIRTFPAARDGKVTNAFIEDKIAKLRNHLGLTFHRLLKKKVVSIELDVLDSDTSEAGFPFVVEPIDPFAYPRSGATGYPKTLLARYGEQEVPLLCHIWPARSDSHFFKLAGAPVDRFQGFYLYRHDRLLSAGQWGGVTNETPRRRLARVAVDIERHLDGFTMSVEKAGVRMVADLVRAVEHAVAKDGTTFNDYLRDAEDVFQEGNRRVRRRARILPPGQGLAPRVKRALEREVDFLEGEEPLRIRWTRLSTEDFLEVDRRARTLWLNSAYREAVLNGGSAGVNDAPILKALLFLLYEDIFRGTAFGPKDKDNVTVWREVLTAAAHEESNGYYG